MLISAPSICSPDLRPSGAMIHPIIKVKNEQLERYSPNPPFTVSNLYLQSVVCAALFMRTTCDLNVLHSWVLSNVTHEHVRFVKK